MDKVYLKHAVAVDTPVPPHAWIYSEEATGYSYDQKSKGALEEAGWADRDNDGRLKRR